MLPKGRKNFLTVYPNIQLSVKDTEDPETHAPIVATAEMLNAANGTQEFSEVCELAGHASVDTIVKEQGENSCEKLLEILNN